MSFRDLIPWYGGRKNLQEKMGEQPFYGLQREIDNLFDRFDWFPTRFGEYEERFGSFTPKINIKENKKNIEVSAELPGMDENDIDVTLSDNTLTIKGEKKSEVEDKREDYYRIERSYGSFYREIPLPEGTDKEKTEASFKKGVLKIMLPKNAKAIESRKKINVKRA